MLLAIATASCAKSASESRRAYAVGTYVGGRGLLGPPPCTYDAPPSVAELSTDERGKPFMAKLVGEGVLNELCGEQKTPYDVVKATAARIDGPASCQVGASDGGNRYELTPLAGTRRLEGIGPGGAEPDWTLGKDCEAVATFGPVLGASDTGGRDVTRTLIALKAGSCTISAALLGVSAQKTISVR